MSQNLTVVCPVSSKRGPAVVFQRFPYGRFVQDGCSPFQYRAACEPSVYTVASLYCFGAGKSRVRRLQRHHGGLLRWHYTSLHQLYTQLAVKDIHVHKCFWDVKQSHMWVNSARLCSKLPFAQSSFSVISHSACCKWLTSCSLSLLSRCLFVSPALSLTSAVSWKQLRTSCASPCLPASRLVFSGPLNPIAASSSWAGLCLLSCHFLVTVPRTDAC